MSSTADTKSSLNAWLKGQNVVLAAIAWGVLALLFFLLFSVTVPGEEDPLWYSLGTYILEETAFFAAGILCLRNWKSPQIVSGKNVWLGLGLGMFCFFVGSILFGWWELYWDLDPDLSLGDLFYVGFYLFVGWGMFLAVLPRKLNLELKEWFSVGLVALIGLALAVWIGIVLPKQAEEASTALNPASPAPVLLASAGNQWEGLLATINLAQAPDAAPAELEETKSLPSWVQAIEDLPESVAYTVNLFYIFFDVILLIIASTLLLAFWGGKFSQSWKMIAAAAFCLYIGDTWFQYADAISAINNVDYSSGSLLEVFYVFTALLFAVGAALEHDVSIQPTRSRSRRRTRS